MKSRDPCANLLAQRHFGIQGFMTILSNKFEPIGMFTESCCGENYFPHGLVEVM